MVRHGLAVSASAVSASESTLSALLHILMLPDFERADRIGEFRSYPESRAFAELLIDYQEDKVLRTVLVGMLQGMPARPGPEVRLR